MTCEHISRVIGKISDLSTNLNNKNSFLYRELGPYDKSEDISRCVDCLTGTNFSSSDSMRESLRMFLERYKEVESLTLNVIRNDALGGYILEIFNILGECDCYNKAVKETADKVGDIYQKEYDKLVGNSVKKDAYEEMKKKWQKDIDDYNKLLGEKKSLLEKYNKLVDDYNDKNTDYHDMKEKYDDANKELHSEKLKYAKNIGDEKLKHSGEKSQLQIQNTRLQEKLEATNSEKIDLRKRLKDKEEENSRLLIKLDDKNNQLTVLRLESGKKDNELERKDEEIRNLKNQAKSSDKRAEKSHGDLLNEKLRSEKGNLELFATELKISSEQVNNLIRYHERLFQARKDYNQANIETHEDNIARIKEELKERKISIVSIQEICRKCERIAELSSELGFEPKTQSQQQANYSYTSANRNRNWQNINPNFTPELIQEWKNYGFTYEECADWVNINPANRQNQAIKEPAYYAWLRDVKKVDSYWVLNEGDSQELGLEFLKWYQEQQYQVQQEQPTK